MRLQLDQKFVLTKLISAQRLLDVFTTTSRVDRINLLEL